MCQQLMILLSDGIRDMFVGGHCDTVLIIRSPLQQANEYMYIEKRSVPFLYISWLCNNIRPTCSQWKFVKKCFRTLHCTGYVAERVE